jgi:uncharacterized protein
MDARNLFRPIVLLLAALCLGSSPTLTAADPAATPGGWDTVKGKRVLYFTKSSGFEHSVVKRSTPDQLSHSERVLTELGRQHGFEVTCTKDGSLFTKDNLAKYDVIAFFTSGMLTKAGTDQTPPLTPEGKDALLQAVRDGKGFVAFHATTDSFHFQPESQPFVAHGSKVDPFIAMLGGEFIRHGPQQKVTLRLVDAKFPGCDRLPADYNLLEEWYTFKDFAPDMHVIQVLETKGMKGIDYQRAPFPYAWARLEGKGRVFYTGLAHREEVWSSRSFQDIILGGLGWAAGNVEAEVKPNLDLAAPGHGEIQPEK